MKTAKQEAIEKEWIKIVGEDNFNRLHLDEDGFSNYSCKSYMGYSDKENLYSRIKKDKVIYRPKSLNGIETNNGWIRIESEEDLPKDKYEMYWIRCNNGRMYIQLYTSNEDFMAAVTHYMPIKKPEPPIY